MTRNPFDSGELGRTDEELDRLGGRLESFAAEASGEPPHDLSARIRAAVEVEASRRSPMGAFLAVLRGPARSVAAIGILALVVVGAIMVGQLAERARESVGSSASPLPLVSPSATTTLTPTPSPSPSPSPSSSPSATTSPSPTPSPLPVETVQPTPSATGTDEAETPRPSQSDDSGSGSSGSGSSGSGSGGGGGGD